MSIITAQEARALLTTRSARLQDARSELRSYLIPDSYRFSYTKTPMPRLTDDYIQQKLAEFREQTLSHHIGKGTRPWFLLDLTADLDPEQAWVGIEYETGFDTLTEYRTAAQYFWDNFNHSTIDHEGCGNYEAEFTLPPVNLSEFKEDGYMMDQFISFMNSKGIEQSRTYDSDDDDYYDDGDDVEVGIHCNFSTPNTRLLDYNKVNRLAGAFTHSAQHIDNMVKVFGRYPYGWFYANDDGHEGHYIEGKLFDSTDSMKEWSRIKGVIGNIIEAFDRCAAASRDTATNTVKCYSPADLSKLLQGEAAFDDVEMTTSDRSYYF